VAPPIAYSRGSAPSVIPKVSGLCCRRQRAVLVQAVAGALYSFDGLVSKLLSLIGAEA